MINDLRWIDIELPEDHQKKWLQISEAFYTPEEESTETQRISAQSGLCHSICGNEDATHPMARGICKAMGLFQCSFWIPHRGSLLHEREYDLLRGDVAVLFSCMTEKEFNELIEL